MRRLLRAIWRILTFPFRLIAAPFRKLNKFFNEEPEDIPLTDVVVRSVNNLESVFEHIDALRRHLLRAVLVLALTTFASFAFARQVMVYLTIPIGGMSELVPIEVTETLGVYMRVSLLVGFAIALPYIAFEIWLFMAPGLRPAARKFSLLSLPAVVLFFLAGMAFSYYVMLPPALNFLTSFLDMEPQLRPSSYFGFVTSMLFWVGMVFEFPLIIYVLASIGLVRARVLLDQWRLAIVIMAVIAAAITPTIDPVTMGLVMAPMIVLYFFSVFLAFMAERGRGRSPAAEQASTPVK